MKFIFLLGAALILSSLIQAQEPPKTALYNPFENVDSALSAVVREAKVSGKHVFIQIGGNWCSWCLRFNNIVKTDKTIDSIMSKSFVVYHLNYSKENENKGMLARFGFPQRFGFPVFVVLNQNGTQIHTQNSVYLEQDKSYNIADLKEFLQQWGPGAINPVNYQP